MPPLIRPSRERQPWDWSGSEGERHHLLDAIEERQSLGLHLLGREPGESGRILDRLALALPPFEKHHHQCEMHLDAAGLVAAHGVEDGERPHRLGDDARLFEQLARGTGLIRLAELLHTAGEAPAPDARRHRALRQQDALAAAYHGKAAEDRPRGIEPVPALAHGSTDAARPSSTL